MSRDLVPRFRKTPEALALQISRSFDNVQYPGDSNLVVMSRKDDEERNEVVKTFSGKHWRDISIDSLRYHYDALFFFTPAAYGFYLPAYLRASVLHYDEAGMIPGSVIFSLTPPEERSGPEMVKFISRVDSLNLAQKRAITSFLRFMLAKYGADFPAYGLKSLIRDFCSITVRL